MSIQKPKSPKFSGNWETFLIFMVVSCGILATLSVNVFTDSTPDPSDADIAQPTSPGQPPSLPQKAASVSLIDVPLATGTEPMEKLVVQSGCAVCHTIPGIAPALGREGPRLVLGTNGPLRLADPQYQGTATTVREYVVESILNPGVYVVPGFADRVMPRWYGKRLNAMALDRIAEYLENVKE